MGRERRFRENCVTSLYDPLISDGRSGSRCPLVPVPSRPNQAHQWTDRCEPIRFRHGCRRRATSHKDVVPWRYTVRRPAASTVSGVEVPR